MAAISKAEPKVPSNQDDDFKRDNSSVFEESTRISQIHELFKATKEHSQGFSTNAKVKNLAKEHRAFLVNYSEINDELISKNSLISENLKELKDLIGENKLESAQILVGQITQIITGTAEMLTSLIEKEAAFGDLALSTLCFAANESAQLSENLRLLDEKILQLKKQGITVDDSIIDSKDEVREKISLIDSVIKNLGKLLTNGSGSIIFLDQFKSSVYRFINSDIKSVNSCVEAECIDDGIKYVDLAISKWSTIVKTSQIISHAIKSVLPTNSD